MADLFTPVESITAETGLVFGYAGEPFLEVAIDRAHGSEDAPRRVAVVSAVSLASVRPYAAKLVGALQVDGTKSLNDLITKLVSNPDQFDALVFHGLGEFAQIVLAEITGEGTPTQAEWGEMARKVSNALRRLTAVAPILYVTCDVVKDEGTSEERLSVNPGLKKYILGDLAVKLFVSSRQEGDEVVAVVQDNASLALKFKAPRRERPAGEQPADSPKDKRSTLGNSGRRRL